MISPPAKTTRKPCGENGGTDRHAHAQHDNHDRPEAFRGMDGSFGVLQARLCLIEDYLKLPDRTLRLLNPGL